MFGREETPPYPPFSSYRSCIILYQQTIRLSSYLFVLIDKDQIASKLCQNHPCDVIKMRDYSTPFLGVFFPTSLLISLIFITSHGSFLTQFCSNLVFVALFYSCAIMALIVPVYVYFNEVE